VSNSTLDHAITLLAQATRPGNGVLPELDQGQLEKLRRYLGTLLVWRERVALIATADPAHLVEHHILDSLHVAPVLSGSGRLADIGSGAGLPGIPLAVAFPAMQTFLVESRRKKASFLRQVRREAQLGNVQVVEGRAEVISNTGFDTVTSRALGSVSAFLALASPLLRSGGTAVAMRGPDGVEEAVEHPEFLAPRQLRYDLAMGRQRILLIYGRR
jgi:16S rRNA (guanine527-N7)-methyltransferase